MSGGQETALILLLALVIDFFLGEPKGSFHPVVWMGRGIGLVARLARGRSPASQLVIGAAGAMIVIAASVAFAFFCAALLPEEIAAFLGMSQALADWASIIISAVLLKLTIAPAGLIRAAAKVAAALAGGDIGEARLHLSALVSRPTVKLNGEQTAAAAIESVGENFTDAVVAPIFFFLLFGPAGAWAYRALNTADSMIGYRSEEFEYTGKAAARLDDVANYIPARAAALIICAAAAILRLDWRGAYKVMLRDRRRTDSPNAGWTMSAAAGALGVRLEKTGHYVLGPELGPASHVTITTANLLMLTATLVSTLLASGLSWAAL